MEVQSFLPPAAVLPSTGNNYTRDQRRPVHHTTYNIHGSCYWWWRWRWWWMLSNFRFLAHVGLGPWSDASRPQHKNISTAAASAAPPPPVPFAGDDMGERQRYAHCKRLQEELQFHSLGLNYTSYLLLLPSIHPFNSGNAAVFRCTHFIQSKLNDSYISRRVLCLPACGPSSSMGWLFLAHSEWIRRTFTAAAAKAPPVKV